MQKLKTIGFVHTPKDMEELDKWLGSTNDQLVLTGAYMMYNLLVTHFNKVLEEQTQ